MLDGFDEQSGSKVRVSEKLIRWGTQKAYRRDSLRLSIRSALSAVSLARRIASIAYGSTLSKELILSWK